MTFVARKKYLEICQHNMTICQFEFQLVALAGATMGYYYRLIITCIKAIYDRIIKNPLWESFSLN